jgi:hypothetical protein
MGITVQETAKSVEDVEDIVTVGQAIDVAAKLEEAEDVAGEEKDIEETSVFINELPENVVADGQTHVEYVCTDDAAIVNTDNTAAESKRKTSSDATDSETDDDNKHTNEQSYSDSIIPEVSVTESQGQGYDKTSDEKLGDADDERILLTVDEMEDDLCKSIASISDVESIGNDVSVDVDDEHDVEESSDNVSKDDSRSDGLTETRSRSLASDFEMATLTARYEFASEQMRVVRRTEFVRSELADESSEGELEM